jgi:hypothetical protein
MKLSGANPHGFGVQFVAHKAVHLGTTSPFCGSVVEFHLLSVSDFKVCTTAVTLTRSAAGRNKQFLSLSVLQNQEPENMQVT